MISKANELLYKSKLTNVSFKHMDINNIDTFGNFDVIISKRCLINIPTWKAKKDIIDIIYDKLNPGGHFIMIEASQQGLDRLNKLRQQFKLNPIEVVWHNESFNEQELFNYFNFKFNVMRKTHFSLYYIISRVFYPYIIAPYEPQHASPLNKIAAKLHRKLPDLYNYGLHMCLDLEKIE